MKRVATSSEHDLQAAVVQHLKLRQRPRVFYCAIPNGEYRSKRTASRLKQQGVIPGAPDLLVLCQGIAYGLELKTEAGHASQAQRTVSRQWGEAGGFYFIAYGLDSALTFLEDIGAIEPSKDSVRVRNAA